MKTRLLSMLVLLVMLISVFPTTAFASGDFKPVSAVSAAGGGGVVPGNPKPGGGKGVWSRDYQGFRIAVLGTDGTPAFTFMGKDYLDLLFSDTSISSMDYYGDGVKTGVYRGTYRNPGELSSYRITIDSIRNGLNMGALTSAVPNSTDLANAIKKVSSASIPRPLEQRSTKSGVEWVIQGDAIKNAFYGSGTKTEMDNTALLYVILNLTNAKTGGALWQPKQGAYTSGKEFTSGDLNRLSTLEIAPIKLMESKGVFISIEPIIWNKLRLSSTQYSYGVYGTQTAVGGIIEWLESGGWFKPTYGAGYGGYDISLFGKAGRRSMITTRKANFDAYRDSNGNVLPSYPWTISPPDDTGKDITNNEVFQLYPGWSLQVYWLYAKEEEKPPEPTPTPAPTEKSNILYESEISKNLSTSSLWGKLNVNFTVQNMSGSGLAILDDRTFFNLGVIAGRDPKLEANSIGDIFTSKMYNNNLSKTWTITGGTATLKDVYYDTVIWRGKDVPTASSYKVKNYEPIVDLIKNYGKTPANKRAQNGSYTMKLSILFDNLADSDLTTSTKHSFDNSFYSSYTASRGAINAMESDIRVEVYRGDTSKKSVGNQNTPDLIHTQVPFGGYTSNHASGFMVQGNTPIKFYPYVRMTYQGTSETAKRDAYVLSEQVSEILPNDFAEAAWFNSNERQSLDLNSTQWTLNARAINGKDGWQGRNQVLPGGAIYSLSTSTSQSTVSLVTWQTIIAEPERSALSASIGSEYTLDSAQNAHNSYVDNAKRVLDSLKVVQWVNKNVKATNAWSNGVLIQGLGGESLSGLGLSVKTSSESKHNLWKDEAGQSERANEGDLDILGEASNTMYFKIFADTSGDIWLARTTSDISELSSINGQNTKSTGTVTVDRVLGKGIRSDMIENALIDPYAIAIEERTHLVSNFVKSLERNTGNDFTASWAKDGKWYNEAWDGIILARQNTFVTVGFNRPGMRSAVLDPMLTPPKKAVDSEQYGTRYLFTQAFLSQFRVASRSDAAIAAGKVDNYIGTFKGRDIVLKDMENLYVSKRFYIPNAVVTDLD